jgi:hypothetical protein
MPLLRGTQRVGIALDFARFDGFHQFSVAVTVGVGAGLLVGIHLDKGGFDAQPIGGVFASALALPSEILVGGRYPTVESSFASHI